MTSILLCSAHSRQGGGSRSRSCRCRGCWERRNCRGSRRCRSRWLWEWSGSSRGSRSRCRYLKFITRFCEIPRLVCVRASVILRSRMFCNRHAGLDSQRSTNCAGKNGAAAAAAAAAAAGSGSGRGSQSGNVFMNNFPKGAFLNCTATNITM